MKEICKKINCRYITWSNGGGDSATMWLVCKWANQVTDERTCGKCKDRKVKNKGG